MILLLTLKILSLKCLRIFVKMSEVLFGDTSDIKKNLTDDYFLRDTLGKGNFGLVKMGQHKITNEKVAIKIINKNGMDSDKIKSRFFAEVDFLQKCNHENIVKYLDIYEDNQNYYFVMEYVSEGELFVYVIKGKFDEKKSRAIFIQLLKAINHCHKKSIAHRDIKLENIFVADKSENNFKVKVGDFGLATSVKNSSLHDTFCGSIDYVPPEIIDKQKYNPYLVDIWSLGVVLYTMIKGCFPFDRKILNIISYECNYKNINPLIVDLFKKIFRPAKERITMDEIFEHPWIKNNI